MTALAKERMSLVERWTRRQLTLASGNKAWKGGIAALDLSTGKVEPGHAETDLLVIGSFAETVDAALADALVDVDFGREIEARWLANATAGDAIAATDVGSLCYVMDDQTVTITPTGRSIAGRVWGVDSVKGVLVERLQAVPSPSASLDGLEAVETAAPAFAAGDSAIPANPNSGAIYEIPATAAVSTVTLPAAAAEGTVLYFVADGVLNAHTVQYRDATGPTPITSALTALKRHMVVAAFLNGAWRANAYVSP